MEMVKNLTIGLSGMPTVFFKATLPLPPSVNDSYKIVRVPKRNLSVPHSGESVLRLGATPALEAFKQEAAWTLPSNCKIRQDIIDALKSSPVKKPISISFKFYFRTLWKRDLDGGIKAAEDACFDYLAEHYLKLNDNRVTDLHALKFVDRQDPRVEIEISCFVV